MLAASAHPHSEQLRLFALGQLGSPDADTVEAHVENCADCGRTVVDCTDDSFLCEVRAANQASQIPTHAHMGDTPRLDTPPSEMEPSAELRDHPRYRVFGVVGRGGMGVVYRGEHRLMERPVALKILGRTLTVRPEMVERFRNEARAAACLTHPNIVQAFDADQAGDVHFLVMEYVAGTDLATLVQAKGPLPVAQACAFVRQAAMGLQHAYEQGMTHRDIKPHNLILAADGTVKILDFGLARIAREVEAPLSAVTAEGMILGTVDYMAPEQADNPRAADVRSDIYALGCTLYHLLTGRVPFPAGTLTQKLRAHAEQEPAPMRTLRPDVPERVAAVVARMMAKSPADRYSTPGEVAAVLANIAEPSRPPSRWQRRLLEAVAGLALAILALGVYRIITDKGELLITVEDPNVQVVVKQNGNIVDIVDAKSDKRLRLYSGDYDLGLKGPEGFKLDVQKVTIRRGEQVLATVERTAKPRQAATLKPDPTAPEPEPFNPPPGLVWRLPNLGGRIQKPALSPDGRYVAVASPDPGLQGKGIIYELRTRREMGQFPSLGFVGFTVDGKHLVSNIEGGRVALYRVPTGKRVRVFTGSLPNVTDMRVSPNGRHILATNFQASIVWDAETGEPVHQRRWYAFFSHDGRHLIGLGFAGDKLVVLRFPGGELVQEFPVQTGCDNLGVTVLPGDHTLFRYDQRTKQAEFWDLETAKKAAVLDLGHAFQEFDLRGAAVSADGRRLLTSHGDGFARLWDLKARREVWRLPIDDAAYGTTFSRDNRFAAAGDDHGTLFVWRLPDLDKPYPPSPKIVRTLADGTREHDWNAHIYHTAYSSDGKYYLATGHGDGHVRIWNGDTSELVHILGGMQWAAFTPDGQHILAVQSDHSFALLELAKGRVVRRLAGHTNTPGQFDISRDGKRAISSGTDSTIRLWDLEAGRELDRAPWGDVNQLCRAVFAPDGKRAASRLNSRAVVLWDVSEDRMRILEQWDVPVAEPHSQIRFTADGKELVVATTKAMYWFSADERNPVRTLPLDEAVEPNSHWCELSADADKLVIVPKWGRTIRVLALPSGEELAKFTAPAELFEMNSKTWFGHPSLSPDNRYLVVPAFDEKDALARIYRFGFPQVPTMRSVK